jgi:L-lysine exporter family protein LysE/ArgO
VVTSSTTWPVVAAGFLFGLSLIVAVGAQNLYVLRQGLLRQYVPLVVGICAASDVALISLGVAIDRDATGRSQWLLNGARTAGALFVFAYAAFAARRAFRPAEMSLEGRRRTASGAAVAGAALAFTWLNPAAYLDTLVLVGTVANTTAGRQWWFAAGAAGASLVWFVLLGFGARSLRPLFTKAWSWRALDWFTAIVMTLVGLRLVVR